MFFFETQIYFRSFLHIREKCCEKNDNFSFELCNVNNLSIPLTTALSVTFVGFGCIATCWTL